MGLMPNAPRRPPGPRPREVPALDDVDRAILAVLARDARIPNAALAQAVGVAPSTAHARVRQLCDRGVIRGFRADLGLAAVGRPVQALVAVRLAAHTREQIDHFRARAPSLPGVVAVFHVSGVNDYLLHVAVPDTDALREFVLEHVTSQPGVGHAETSLIFEHISAEEANLRS